MGANLRTHSKSEFTTRNDKPNHKELDTGSLQRIADACELMAKDRQGLIDQVEILETEVEHLRSQANHHRFRLRYANRRISAFKGVISRMKNAKAIKEAGM
jgi:hypothetical protein